MPIHPCQHARAHESESTSFEDLSRGVRTFLKFCPDCGLAWGEYETPAVEEQAEAGHGPNDTHGCRCGARWSETSLAHKADEIMTALRNGEIDQNEAGQRIATLAAEKETQAA